MHILRELGIYENFCNPFNQYLSTVSYLILLNESKFRNFTPTRELSKGDHVLPYLFIIAIETLSRLIMKAELRNIIHGINISKQRIPINHLFYIDSVLLLCKTVFNKAHKLMRIL